MSSRSSKGLNADHSCCDAARRCYGAAHASTTARSPRCYWDRCGRIASARDRRLRCRHRGLHHRRDQGDPREARRCSALTSAPMPCLHACACTCPCAGACAGPAACQLCPELTLALPPAEQCLRSTSCSRRSSGTRSAPSSKRRPSIWRASCVSNAPARQRRTSRHPGLLSDDTDVHGRHGWHGWLWVALRTLNEWPCRSEPS